MGQIEKIMMEHSEYLSDGIAAFEGKHFGIASQILSGIADAGNAEAQFRMAVMQQNGLGMVVNETAAFNNMKNSAKQNHPLALHGLGFMYYEGECAEQNFEQALHWFKKAADQGLTGSMMTISSMYTEGQGVKENEAKAKEWMDKAMAG